MKFKSMQKTVGFLLSVLGIQKIPIKDNAVNFSDEQLSTLEKKFGKETIDKAVQAMNQEIEQVSAQEAEQGQIDAIQEELNQVLDSAGLSEEDALKIHSKGKSAAKTQEQNQIVQLVQKLVDMNKGLDAKVQKLIQEPEPEGGENINIPESVVDGLHDGKFVLGAQTEWNKIEGRSWNENLARLAGGKKPELTDYASATQVDKLNGDLELFYRKNPERLRSLHRDNFQLPSFWPRRTDVDDQVADGHIVSDEITQARKLPWLPKNKQLIQAETRKVFPVSIDMEFLGHQLQRYEQSWLNMIVGGGSSPYKIAFVEFLANEFDKKARAEDRKSAVKGVYVQTPDDATVGGKAINRQDGILYQLWKAIYVNKKVKTTNLGYANPQNIVDYVKDVVEKNLTEEIRDETNLVYYMEPDHMRWYKTRLRELRGTETLITQNDFMTIEHYPNIRLEPLHDLAGTGTHFITFDDNIEIMEKLPNEKSLYRFEQLKRKIYVHGDYKMGVGFIHMGMKVQDSDPDAFKVQSVWTNGVNPLGKDYFVPVYDDASGEINAKYSNLSVDANWNTNVTAITNVYEGQIVKLRGNTSLSATKNLLASGSKLNLNSNFDLSSGGTITLYVDSSLNLNEIKRTTSAPTAPEDNFEFNATTIDFTDGSTQTFVGSSAKTLAEIINGTEGNELTIIGDGTAAFTVQNVGGNISVDSNAVLDTADDQIKLVYVDGVWTEVSRTIAL